MGGGHIQLVAFGEQDMYITGNPQMSYFQSVYKRHTNFSIECIEIQHSGAISENGGILDYKVGRHGDLLYKTFLDITFPEQTNVTSQGYINYTNVTANALIKQIDFEIGEQLIDRQYGHWYDVRNEFYDEEHAECFLINKQLSVQNDIKDETIKNLPKVNTYLPLHFWFCDNPGLALPLIALQYHNVDFKIHYRALKHLVVGDGIDVDLDSVSFQPPIIKLYADYIYLDTEERKRFAKSSHEYLIEQVQLNKLNLTNNVDIKFNHSIKSLFWVIQHNTVIQESTTVSSIDISNNDPDFSGFGSHKNDYFNYETDSTSYTNNFYLQSHKDHFNKCKLVINGVDRFNPQPAYYFRTIHPHNLKLKMPDKTAYMYSFALKPTQFEPSGSFNFSKIDSSQLQFVDGSVDTNYTISVYAVNYNILRIMSGMGGILFSN